jgi:UDP-GlcNAc3NAcA epimerase
MRIITVIGARPQFVKAAIVSQELSKNPCFKERIVHTGQHFDKNMSDIFFEEMEIPKPNYNLNINGLSHGAMTGQMLEGIEKVCAAEKPDFVMVYGDTNSTIAGALAAKKMGIGVIHIESGLRSFNLNMPEEINRILTDRISDILFCPTNKAIENLRNDGIFGGNAVVVQNGDVMQDAAMFYSKKSELKSSIIEFLNLRNKDFILATFHRQENTDSSEKLSSIISALNKISREVEVIVPLHPRTRKIIERDGHVVNFTSIDPVGYFDMLELIKKSKLVLTDSGGLQKEAYFFNKFCITLREETEWVELVENNYNSIVGSDESKIMSSFEKYYSLEFIKRSELYGGGNASAIIRKTLEAYL